MQKSVPMLRWMMPKLTKRLGRSCSSALLAAGVILLLLSCSESGVCLHYHIIKNVTMGLCLRRHFFAEFGGERKGNSVRSDLLVITS